MKNGFTSVFISEETVNQCRWITLRLTNGAVVELLSTEMLGVLPEYEKGKVYIHGLEELSLLGKRKSVRATGV